MTLACLAVATLSVSCSRGYVQQGSQYTSRPQSVQLAEFREPDGSVRVEVRLVEKRSFDRETPVSGQPISIVSGYTELLAGTTNENGLVQGRISQDALARSEQRVGVKLGYPFLKTFEWPELEAIRDEVRTEALDRALAARKAEAKREDAEARRAIEASRRSGPPPTWTRDAVKRFRATLQRRGYLNPDDPAYYHAMLAQASLANCLVMATQFGAGEDVVLGGICRSADRPKSQAMSRVLGDVVGVGLFADAFAVPEPVWAQIVQDMLRAADVRDGPNAFAKHGIPQLKKAVARVPQEKRDRINEIARHNMLLRSYP